jgi:hypothetical protein
MDEHELQERLRNNPHLRIVGEKRRPTDPRTIVLDDVDSLREAAEAMLEAELQSEVKKIAVGAGFLTYHTYRSKRSEPGFPDLVLLRVGLRCQLYFVELKRQSEEPTDKQKEWLAALEAFKTCAGGFAEMNVSFGVFVWRPMDLLNGAVERCLTATKEAPK